MIQQISVYTENKKGALGALVRVLSNAGVDLRGITDSFSDVFPARLHFTAESICALRRTQR